ncbi:glycosyltransferase family 2 protein [Phycomyces blakesleeanus NRRL 1555(-)]|uniref:chitin synthase n=1 Tax=Phycomyces blakesleeanus (strain ATCC 8743b / DSM 1359 / FGSC 10004 / NBRC 33097 / NRRL 1555) TaxID=763407 RepID=A0A162TBP9_PHYB8|nr:glycosyltransferase family 2 protein [Phycomyces blakesleeanus NRRL 1555(-)]OAD65823.1 glycosyltransferase family 2 protein [Phycomyces blakesleeanus NRRL 1555(-)]|eukprot:XP_018283863.1 glycosyltransferase family 2 protein [Phycomyces blakesleeanus NRRL 1555(-)]
MQRQLLTFPSLPGILPGAHVTDLTDIENLTEEAIVTTVRARFLQDKIYTRIRNSILLAVNPYKDIRSSIQEASANYLTEYKDTENRDRLDPHIFQHVNQAYFHMRRTGQDQSIVFSGLCGSGKSELHQWALYHLVTLSSGHKKKQQSKVQELIQMAYGVLEAFGHAKTVGNGNASRFGKYLELQFNERGRMTGAKFLDYMLEKSRVTHFLSDDERNFHVFYYLLHGTNAEEKTLLRLQDGGASYGTLYRNKEAARTAACGLAEEDAEKYAELRSHLKALGINKTTWLHITQVLAAILHLASLQFMDDASNMQDSAIVKNTEELDIAADLLGVEPKALESVLTYKTKLIKRDLTTIFLNAEQAASQRDHLIQVLYSLLFGWIVEVLNKRLCKANFQNFIGIVDFPGAEAPTIASFDKFCVNFSNEKLQHFMLQHITDRNMEVYSEAAIRKEPIVLQSNAECLQLITDPSHGLLANMGRLVKAAIGVDENVEKQKTRQAMDEFLFENSKNSCLSTKRSDAGTQLFTIQHFTGQVTYSTVNFFASDSEALSADFVSLFRSNNSHHHSTHDDVYGDPLVNELVSLLFAQKTIATEMHPKNSRAVVSVQQSSKPRRSPSTRKSKDEPTPATGATINSRAEHLGEALNDLTLTLEETKIWWVICLRPNDLLLPNSCDAKKVTAQIKLFSLIDITMRSKHEYTMRIDMDEFCDRYVDLIQATVVELDAEPKDKCSALKDSLRWTERMMMIGEDKVYLSEHAWAMLENKLRSMEKREQRRARCIAKGIPFVEEEEIVPMTPSLSQDPPSCFGPSMTDVGSVYSEDCIDEHHHHHHHHMHYDETESVCSSHMCDGSSSMSRTPCETEDASFMEQEETITAVKPVVLSAEKPSEHNERKTATARRGWVILTWVCTWWIPSIFMSTCGGMRRSDIRMAWREKVTLCVLIFLLCAAMVWFIAFFGQLVCPHQDLFTQSELQAKSNRDNAYIAIRGEVFDLTSFAPRHWASEVIPANALFQYSGQDASDLFPVQVSALCDGLDGIVPKEVTLNSHINITDSNAVYHDFRYFQEDYRPDWYFEQMVYLRKNYRIGFMGYDPVDIKNQASVPVQIGGINTQRQWAILHNNIYDLTSYMMGGRGARVAEGQSLPADVNIDFIDNSITELFRQLSGSDVSAHFDSLPLTKVMRDRQLVCLRNLFLVGKVDTRNSLQCLISEYLLLLITGFLCSVILFKFLAALRLTSEPALNEYDKFIICQVPCYTEGEESLIKTINSLTVMKYDDKRKLLFLIADGMIVGSGNDRSTPRIVLDILGVDPNTEPEPMSFLSLGDGRKQHNMGKVYSGLYECSGHVVPYIVVVKVGTPEEHQKPGNRGKRDSQMVLMRFLNKVHFDAPMTPLELEIHHQLKNVIGVNPGFYEFVLMVDADTEVLPESLTRMVSCFVNDSKIVGLCGETMLSNEKDTWVTMIQVYEYYISHHLAKAFESLFGSVTCLPGCFCMYRIRSTTRNQPLLASNQVIYDYAENVVDTLHKKNLLHLGEDRYLTTLILKHFPNYKTKFTPDAACMTNAPDRWPVLLSQRRRWINSTVHNLGELMFLPQLCGFCCFSMRFVVMLDLLSTLVMPAVVCYLGYLVYQLCTNTNQVPLMSIITLAGVYGLQAIIFIMRRKWEHVGWMIVYVLAIPVFSFLIPMYAFWHFDDFSWGNTRIVVSEKGLRKGLGPDEGVFEPSSIPTKRWSEHEEEEEEEGKTEDQTDWEERSACSKHTVESGCSCEKQPSHPMTSSTRSTLSCVEESECSIYSGDQHSVGMYDRQYSQQSSYYYESSIAYHDPRNPPSIASHPLSQMEPYTSGPSEATIVQEIEHILDDNDLMRLTKKQVRDTLSEVFGMDMSYKRDFINQCIETLLAERL